MFCRWEKKNHEDYVCKICDSRAVYNFFKYCSAGGVIEPPVQDGIFRHESADPQQETCAYLGKPRTTQDGVTVMVKCTCSKTSGAKEQFHRAHDCHAPEHQRSNGKPGRCLPSMRQEFDDDHKIEASLYHLCYHCEIPKQISISD